MARGSPQGNRSRATGLLGLTPMQTSVLLQLGAPFMLQLGLQVVVVSLLMSSAVAT